MSQELAGRRALVTAGASGIGRVIARRFAEAGAKVFICDVDDAALAAFGKENPGIGATRCDVADIRQVDTLFATASAALGGLDILVNNAGVAGPTAPVEAMTVGDWERCVAVNLHANFYCTRKAVPLLKAAGGGSIVNLSSVAGRLGFPLRTPYAASKWAIVGLTKSLAMELGTAGIRVNCIQPGVVEGDRINRVISAKAQAHNVSFEQERDAILENVSLRTMVTADDIAAMALFVCSAAGARITGQALSVCGDVQVLQ